MAKQPPKHGGKRPGAGRPPKPPGEQRNQVFSVKLTADEKRLLEEANARAWARDVLLKAAGKAHKRIASGEKGNRTQRAQPHPTGVYKTLLRRQDAGCSPLHIR